MEQKTPIQQAVAAIMSELGKYEARSFQGGGKEASPAEGMEQECAACAAGECAEPEHMSEEDVEGVSSMYGE